MPTTTADVPIHLVVDFDVHDQSIAATTHDALTAVRDVGPVTWSPAHGGHWLVTSYEAARHVLTHPEIFSSRKNSVPRFDQIPRTIPLEYDAAEHSEYRRFIDPLFAPQRMRSLEDTIRALCISLIDRFATKGSCELVSEYAHALPAGMFLALMGWPMDDLQQFMTWTDWIINPPAGISDEERLSYRQRAVQGWSAYFGTMIAAYREKPDDTYTSAIVNGRFANERPLTDEELVNMFGLLMIAGLHTVRGVLGIGVIAIARDDSLRQQLLIDPAAISPFVEEMLRMEAPASPGRIATQDVELGGVTIREGDRVMVSLTAANRDPDEYAEAAAIILDRDQNRHMAFAVGPHRCVGSHLARVELRVALEELLKRVPDFRLASEPRLHSGQVRGVLEIQLAFTPTATA